MNRGKIKKRHSSAASGVSLELLLHSEMQEIFDEFAECFGVRILFFSVDGRILRRGLDLPNSPFCRMIQEKLCGSGKCFQMDEDKKREALSKKRLINYRCHAGIDEAVGPVFIDGQLAGFVMIGQFRSSDSISGGILKSAGKKGMRRGLLEAFRELPFYSSSRIRSMTGLLGHMLDYMLMKKMISLGGDRIIGKALLYMERNLHRTVSLGEVAVFVGRSKSSLSHSFRKLRGASFKEILIGMKLDRAEFYFRNFPGFSISEVAAKVGYEDALYFSRLYSKYRGMPPVEFRKNLKR